MTDFSSDFDNFENDVLGGLFNNLLGWDKNYYAFNRPILDMKPYKEKHLQDREILIFNVVGLSKKDVSVTINKEGQINYLNINGERKDDIIDNQVYNIKARFSIDSDKVANISYKVENGLLYITLFYKKPEKSNIKIDYEE